jgi:hypothetical protein
VPCLFRADKNLTTTCNYVDLGFIDDVRCGSNPEVIQLGRHVRSTFQSGRRQAARASPFRANTGSRSSLNHFIDSSVKAGRDDNARRRGGFED